MRVEAGPLSATESGLLRVYEFHRQRSPPVPIVVVQAVAAIPDLVVLTLQALSFAQLTQTVDALPILAGSARVAENGMLAVAEIGSAAYGTGT